MNENILKTSILILFLLANQLFSQIPDERSYEWNSVNDITFDLSEKKVITISSDDLNSVFDPSAYIQEFIDNNDESIILLPPGDYYLDKAISMRSNVVLSGHPDGTKLIFDMPTPDNAIKFYGSIDNIEVEIIGGIEKGSTQLKLSKSISSDHILISMYDPDHDFVTSDWAESSIGQILKIISKEQDQIEIQNELSFNYSNISPFNTTVKEIEPIKNSGVKCLSIEYLNQVEQQLSTIDFRYAVDCFVSGVESKYCIFSHVRIGWSSKVLVENSYFFDAHSHGGGGRGYGVAVQYCSNLNLVSNNIFEHLRHSILLQAGANTNVISYNYSIDPYWTGVSLPEDSAGDLVLHGNYVFGNLFESNVAQNIVIDDSHGENGPNNVFFRNRALNYGIFMNFNPPSDGQIFIANEVTNNGFLKGLYALQGNNRIEIANNIKGEILPAGSEQDLPSSLYLDSKPSREEDFPSIGYPLELQESTISSEIRYEYNRSICENITVGVIDIIDEDDSFKVFTVEGIFIKSIKKDQIQLLEDGLYILVSKNSVKKVLVIN